MASSPSFKDHFDVVIRWVKSSEVRIGVKFATYFIFFRQVPLLTGAGHARPIRLITALCLLTFGTLSPTAQGREVREYVISAWKPLINFFQARSGE